MNTAERKILRDAIRAVARHNENAWWELKRQIWDFGYQSYYPMQDEFRWQAERAVDGLPHESREQLRAILTARVGSGSAPDDSALVTEYSALIIEEIVRRAGIAAYRTVHW